MNPEHTIEDFWTVPGPVARVGDIRRSAETGNYYRLCAPRMGDLVHIGPYGIAQVYGAYCWVLVKPSTPEQVRAITEFDPVKALAEGKE